MPVAAQTPAWTWGLQTTNPTPTDTTGAAGQAVGVDALGRVYVGGSYSPQYSPTGTNDPVALCSRQFGTAGTVGPGVGGFVAQATAAGQWAWVVAVESTSAQSASGGVATLASMAVSPAGEVYAVGSFTGAGVRAGTGTATLPGGPDDGMWVACFGPTGVCRWVQAVAGTTRSQVLTPDPITGGVVLAGTYYGALALGATSLPSVTGPGQQALYVAHLSGTGQWGAVATSSSNSYISGRLTLAAGPSGQVAVGGQLGVSAMFGPHAVPANSASGFVAQLNAANQWDWVTTARGVNLSYVYGLGYTRNGALWAGGTAQNGAVVGPLTLTAVGVGGPSGLAGWLGLLSSTGQWQQVGQLSTTNVSYGFLGPLVVDANDEAVALATLTSANTAQGQLGTLPLTSAANQVLYEVVRFNRAGQWTDLAPVPQPVYQDALRLSAVALNGGGDLYATGMFSGGLAVGNNTLNGNSNVYSNNYGDAVLLKLSNATAPLSTRTPALLPLTLSPTPAHHTATLRRPAPATTAETVRIVDALGRTVRQFALFAATVETTLDLSGLPPGLYLVRCGTATARLVVE